MRGLNRTYLSAVELSEQNILIDNIYRISHGLNVEPGVFHQRCLADIDAISCLQSLFILRVNRRVGRLVFEIVFLFQR